MTKRKINQLGAYLYSNLKANIKKKAKKFKISTTLTHRLLKTKTNMKYSHQESLAKRSEQQRAVTHPKCRCLYKRFLTRTLFWVTNLILFCQTSQLLGMMGITPVNPKTPLQGLMYK